MQEVGHSLCISLQNSMDVLVCCLIHVPVYFTYETYILNSVLNCIKVVHIRGVYALS